MKDKFKELIKRMIPNPLRLSIKMFGLVWFILLLHIFLKVTFDYWQPYVIPTPQLEKLSNFIDKNIWLKIILDGVLYLINGIFVILCCLQQWWFKNKKQTIIVISLIVVGYILVLFDIRTIPTLILSILMPLIINRRKWLWIILTFIISNVFTLLSLWLDGFTNTNNMNYIIKVLFQFDYYIMLVLNYILFNIIRIYKEIKVNGK